MVSVGTVRFLRASQAIPRPQDAWLPQISSSFLAAFITVSYRASTIRIDDYTIRSAYLRGARFAGICGATVTVNHAVGQQAFVSGDEFLLENAVTNLLENAIEFSPAETTVTVSVERQGKTVVVRILDEGPGIPAYALNKIFDRFYSLARPSTGKRSSGLGLCFAREVANLHHGSVTVQNRKDSQGTEAVLTLAAAEPSR